MFSHPDNNVEHLHIREGWTVADLGAGVGHYTLAAARKVGTSGKVFSVDVQQEMLDVIAGSAHDANVPSVHVVRGDIERRGGTRLRDQSVDAVIVANTFFQLDDKAGCVQEVARITKPGGVVLVVDWIDSYKGLGPQPEYIVSPEELEKLFVEHGFSVRETFDAGEHHFGILVEKSV